MMIAGCFLFEVIHAENTKTALPLSGLSEPVR